MDPTFAAPASPPGPQPRQRLAALRQVTGIDFHIFVTLLFRGWSIMAGGLMIVIVPLCFSKLEQGYYYTFTSLLALSIFFELGINQVVIQVVGHEFAHLRLEAGGSVSGPARQVGRLASVVQLLGRWYAAAALLFVLIVGPAGSFFFRSSGQLPASDWLWVWWALVVFTAANLYLSPQLAVLEGMNSVGQIARLRLAQSMCGYVLLWVGLAMGAGLWMVPIIPATAAITTWAWLAKSPHPLHTLRRHRDDEPMHRIAWRTEVLPFQWRIAVSWISGYFIFQLFTPLIFRTQGAVAAGRLGITLSIFAAITTLGLSWVNAKLPVLTSLISRGARGELNATFKGVAYRSIAFTALSCAVAVAALASFHELGLPLSQRVADLPTITCLAVITTLNTVAAVLATFMRAHKEEPMLPVSVAAAVLTSAAAFLGSREGVLPMVLAYGAVVLFVATPWTIMLFNRYHRRTR